MPILGTGITITFSNGFLAEILNVDDSGLERPNVDVTHSTSTTRDYLPGKIPDYGQLDCEIAFDPGTKPPLTSDPETVEVTYSNGVKWSRSGYLQSFRYTAPTGPTEDRMTATATLKFSGDLTVTTPA